MSVTFYLCDSNDKPIEEFEFQLGNSSAHSLLKLLGLEDGELIGSCDLDRLELALSLVSDYKKNEFNRPYSDNHGIELSEEGIKPIGRYIDFGYSADEELYVLSRFVDSGRRMERFCGKITLMWG